MRYQLKRLGGMMAALTIGSCLLQAQQTGFDGGLNLRVGYGLTAADDNLNRRTLGFGFELGYTAPWGRVAGELGFIYKPGFQYLSDVTTFPIASSDFGAAVPLDSTDSRKNQVGGITLRLSYEKAFKDSAFFIRAGVQLGSLKYRQEYVGDVTDDATYEDTYNGTVNKSTLTVSPYIGVGYNLNEYSALSVNLMLLSYKSANYVHVLGDSTMDYVETKSRSIPHIELGYTFRF